MNKHISIGKLIALSALLVLPLLASADTVAVNGGYITNGNLVCSTNYFKTLTGCSRAPDNGWAYADQWGCNGGYVKIGSGCILSTQVLSDGVYCNDGYVASHGQCLHADQAYANDTCTGRYGANVVGRPLYGTNVDCVCATGYYWNAAKTACVPPATATTLPYGVTANAPVSTVSSSGTTLSLKQQIAAQINALLIQVAALQKQLASLN